jgi:phosphonate transport system substrate-binding protein
MASFGAVSRFFRFLRAWPVGVLLFCSGCGEDVDTKIVDFSHTVANPQPRDKAIEGEPLRVAVGAMISPKETFDYYRQVLDYMGRRLNRPVRLIQRKTYAEINELFAKRQVDLGVVCSGPYATQKEKYGFELLATPIINGSQYYHSYLIVNRDSPIQSLEGLRGKVFAFTDPDSNTGKLVPAYWLAKMGERPEGFFEKTLYTYSHDNSILAVARGLVDGACVDSLIWEYYHRKNPEFTSKTRIVRQSEPFGIPPFVGSTHTPETLRKQALQILLSMHQDSEGQGILKELMIDRFEPGREEWYESIREMEKGIMPTQKEPDALAKPEH